jgi:hypothetical protein
LASDEAVESIQEALDEMDHLRGIFQSLANRLTDEEYLDRIGAGEAKGPIMDEGLMLAMGNERLERLIQSGRALLSKTERALARKEG